MSAQPSYWLTIFSSSDPSIWLTNTSSSLGLDNIPQNITKVKMTYNGEDSPEDDIDFAHLNGCGNIYNLPYHVQWNGTNSCCYNGCNLGIISIYSTSASGDVLLNNCSCGGGFNLGYGFGRRFSTKDRQGFGWYGISNNIYPIPVVDIKVWVQN